MSSPPKPDVFSCTPGGAVAASINRFRWLLIILALSMILAALVAWTAGRLIPGMIAAVVAGVVGLAWRMSNDLRPRRLTLEPALMLIETPRQLIPVSIEGAQIRSLEPEEIEHLESLASAGGFVAGSGGFDSHLLGEFDLYASDFAHAQFIQAAEGRYVVTPDRPARFLESFRQMAASPLLQSSAHE